MNFILFFIMKKSQFKILQECFKFDPCLSWRQKKKKEFTTFNS